jgi:Bacterial Ig-like domain
MSHPARLGAPRRPRRRSTAALAALLTLLTTIGVTSLAAMSPASAVLATTGLGPIDPGTGFPSSYTDTNGLSLQPCLDGLPICSATTADLMDPAGGGEGFYYSADATLTAGPAFKYHTGLEAAWVSAPDPTVNNRETFVRTQISAQKGGLAASAKYTVTDPWGTLTCVSDANGFLLNTAKGCRFQTAAAAGDFTSALAGRLTPTGPGGTGTAAGPGPFLSWDTVGQAVGAPPAGYVGDFVTPHKVTGSPTGFNTVRIQGPNITSTCAGGTIPSCVETDQLVVQGKVQPGASAAVSASSWDFGNVPASPAVKKSFTYSNTSTDGTAVNITGVATSAATSTDYTVGGTCAAGPLASGASCTVDVTYTPTGASPDTGSVTVSSDTPTIGDRTITLTGTSVGVPVIDTPAPSAALGFGNQTINKSSPESIIVVGNNGVADVSLSARTLNGTGATHFSLVGTTNTCDAGVSPGGGCEVGVVFAPTTTGTKNANVKLTFNDGTVLNVPLTGTGVAPPPDTTAPTAPSLTATRAGTTANLTWTAATDNVGVTGYQVLRDGTQVGANLPATTRSFSDTALAPGAYSYTVKAVDAAGNASPSSNAAAISVPTPDTTPPSAPTLTGARTGTTANLTWTAATDNVGVTGYQVFRGGTQVGTDLPVTARSLDDPGLAPGTYSYTVKAMDAAGNAAPASNTVSVTVPAPDTTPPSAPVLTGSVTGTTANLTWTAATDNVGVTGYQVFRDGAQVGANLGATARSFGDTALAAGTYTYTVKAMDTAGNAAPSSNALSLSVSPTAADTAPPSAPVLSGSVTGTTANLSWTTATDNVGVTGYQVFRNGTQVGANLATTATTFSQANLAAGTYSYTVKAMDAAGNAAPASNAVSLTVAATAAPTVSARTPAANALAVPVGNDITATFSKAVTGVGTGTFQVKNPAGTVVAGVVTQSATTPNQWTLNPNASLATDTKYTVTLTGGATAIRDSAGAQLATATWSFTTGPAPTLTARTPAVGGTAISRTANVTATFSEAVQGVTTTSFTLKNAATGAAVTSAVTRNGTTNQWILNPGVTLAANTKYTVTLSSSATGIRDLAGNLLPAAPAVVWSFTTGA